MPAIERPPAFLYHRHRLHADKLPLEQLAKRFGTPLYVYSASAVRQRFRAFDAAFRGIPHTVCYSVKANSNLAILKSLAKLGAGFDVVSGGEIERVLKAHRPSARNIVFSGVGKTAAELDLALRSRILIFNVESESELDLLESRAARARVRARIALRVNPDVFAQTHPYISTGLREHKFGVPIADARSIYLQAARSRHLDVAGVSVHIGSQITQAAPFLAAMKRVAALINELRADGHTIRYADAGGGIGIPYLPDDFAKFSFEEQLGSYAAPLTELLRPLGLHLLLEPGRSILGPAGLLLTRVLYIKQNGAKRFLIVDAAMNDLIRPSLYNAYHEIVPVALNASESPVCSTYDVVGPVCETGDFFARDRKLPAAAEGDLLAILDAGAYGMSLSSNYNTRPRPAEILVDGRKARVIRKRETVSDLMKAESR